MRDLEEQLRSYSSWLVSTADERAADDDVQRPVPLDGHRERRGRGWRLIGVAAAAAIVVAGGLGLIRWAESDHAPSDERPPPPDVTETPTTSTTSATQEIVKLPWDQDQQVPVVGDGVDVSGARVYEGAPGADITSELPDALRAALDDEAQLEPVPADEYPISEDYAREGFIPIVTIGRLDGVAFALHLSPNRDGVECVLRTYIATSPDPEWVARCSPRTGGLVTMFGASTGDDGRRRDHAAVVWPHLPEETALVAVTDDDDDGPVRAQRPRGGAVVFEEYERRFGEWWLIAYDATGEELERLSAP